MSFAKVVDVFNVDDTADVSGAENVDNAGLVDNVNNVTCYKYLLSFSVDLASLLLTLLNISYKKISFLFSADN